MRVLRGALIAALLAWASLSGPFDPGLLRAQEPAVPLIAGTVVDAVSKEPIAGVRVSAWGRGYVPDWTATTGSLGEFEFRRVSPGQYRLQAIHPLYLPESGSPSDAVRVVTVTDDAPATGLVLSLARRPIVSGTIRDDAGEPVVDVEVVAFRRMANRTRLEPDQTVRTDDRGVYRIVLSSPAAEHLIRVRGDSARPPQPTGPPQPQPHAALTYPTLFFPAALRPSGAHPVTVGLNEERTGIDFTLSPLRGVRVSGTIAGADRVPFGLLPVSLLSLDSGDVQWDLPAASVRVGPDGRFSFANVPRGTYVLWAVAFPRHADRPTPTMRGPSTPWSSEVIRTFSIGGQVAGPPPDGDTLWIKAPVVVEAQDVELTLGLARGARLSGRVVFEGTSPPPAPSDLERTAVHIFAVDGTALGSVPIGGVRADGRFSIVGLPPGAYELHLSGRGGFTGWNERSFTIAGRDVTGRPIQIGTADITDVMWSFVDRRTRLSGVLRDSDGRAVVGAQVAVFPTDRSLWVSGLLRPSARVVKTGPMGEFDVVVRGAGEYFVARVPASLSDRVQEADVLDDLSRSAAVVPVGEGQQATVALNVTPER